MNEYSYIVTHPGGAHRDDLYACAIAQALFGVIPLARREPTERELRDSRVLVLDVGGEHAPERSCYDHHQLGRDAEPECALSLFLKAINLEKWFLCTPWYKTTVVLDSKGPMAAARSLGLERLPVELLSPMELGLLQEFSEYEVVPDEFLKELETLGHRLLQQAQQSHTLSLSAERVEVIEVAGLSGYLVEEMTPGLTGALAQRRSREGKDISFSISTSDRDGESWSLYRYDDDSRLDLSLVEREPNVIFAHRGGFIAKLKDEVSLEQAKAVLAKAVKGK